MTFTKLLLKQSLSLINFCRVRDKPLSPGLGMAASILLHLYSPMKVKFVQGLNSIELWRCGAQRKVIRDSFRFYC